MIAFSAGLAFAVVVIVSARLTGFERDRSFYPTVLIVIALLYVLFAAIDGRTAVIIPELVIALSFCLLAMFGYWVSPWWLVFGYALHGAFDVVHPAIVTNTGVPTWWPALCLAVDGTVAAYLALRIRSTPDTLPDNGFRR